jgi:selenide,water dikinase
MITKGSAQPGDVLVISKPLGFGTTTTALKQGKAKPQDVAEVVSWMVRLNKSAADLALAFGVRSGTDITGFSLLGHAWELAEASNVGLRIHLDQVPFTSGARFYAENFIFPGGTSDNRLYYREHVTFDTGIDEASQMLLFDAQTSGGLLLAVPRDRVAAIKERATEMQQPLWVIGEVVSGDNIAVING